MLFLYAMLSLYVFVISLPFVSAASNFTVGIIGAGISGLYAATILQSLGIKYEILEANDRPGGRIWTHYFDREAWQRSRSGQPEYYDYFDVGAMRIPKSPFMDRLIGNRSSSLTRYINDRVNGSARLNFIPYFLNMDSNLLYYNNIRRRYSDSRTGDPFKTGLGAFAKSDPVAVWANMINGFLNGLNKDFFTGLAELNKQGISVRQYLSSVGGLSFSEINWLETFVDATGHFDLDLTEIVLEDWFFGHGQDNVSWVALEGGMIRLIEAMTGLLRIPVKYSEQVSIITRPSSTSDASGLTVTTTNGKTYTYDHVISAIPLGALQFIDLSSLSLPFELTSAIRMIHYDDAMKIGIKFKTRWWQHQQNTTSSTGSTSAGRGIFGGQSESDLPIRTVVYPSYGTNVSDAAAVLIASYTWAQDSTRLAALSPDFLINQTLLYLARMHDLPPSYLQSQYLAHFAHSWSFSAPYAVGAFPEFAPGQMAGMLPLFQKPEGRLHFAGDAVSAGHAWMVGGLDSAYRCIREILEGKSEGRLLHDLEEKWAFDASSGLDSSSATATAGNMTNTTPRAAVMTAEV